MMGESKKVDRRVSRTKSALQRSLHELVKEKGYEATTVEDITQRANLGRATFYLHYKGKEDLLLEGLEPRLTALVDEVSRHPLNLWIKDSNGNLVRPIFETVKQNADVFTLIIQEQSTKVYEQFHGLIAKLASRLIYENPWAKPKIDQLPVPLDYLVAYFSGALWSTIVWWANNGFHQTTEEMAVSFRVMFLPGLLRALQVKDFQELVDSIL